MHVKILYCEVCHYLDRAHDLAAELRDTFGATTEVVEGKLGQFDVLVDGELVASRGQSFFARMLPRDAPKPDAVIAAIQRHVAPRECEFCEKG
ncbi:MAG: Rdx family protein [Polyangiaceae bacterium]